MAEGIYNCVVLMERLRECGYDGGISILKDYVHTFRPAKQLPAVRRYETAAGKQAQMDWGICHYTDVKGEVHKVPVFVMVLGHSRVKYVEFTSRCDLASQERCMVNAFTYFGGIPEKVLTDNMKTVIIGRDVAGLFGTAHLKIFQQTWALCQRRALPAAHRPRVRWSGLWVM